MSQLFCGSDSDSDENFKTRNDYATNYNSWRQKEELNKLKAKYGETALNVVDDDSCSSSDDSEDEQLSQVLEKDFFKALASLKTKSPRIYDENIEFFGDSPKKKMTSQRNAKEQPMYIKDYERKMLVEKGGIVNESDEEQNIIDESPTYAEEQHKLKENVKNALMKVNEDDDEEWGGMFRSRKKTKEENLREENDYKEWLLGRKNHIDDKETESELKSLKDYWNDPNLAEGEKFLRDYILNEKFLEKEDDNHVPTYEEIVHDSDAGLSDDESAIKRQEEFEHKYNYRFEEPDQEFIKRYPRTMENSLRRPDDRRKTKRAETKERKQTEKNQKLDEIKQMQALKQKEIEEKISKLKEITGNTDLDFNSEDIDGDFDPDAHDERMRKLFDAEFYHGAEDDQKPEFPDIDEELELENWDGFDGNSQQETEFHCEDDDFNMDCDYDPEAAQKDQAESSTTRNRKKRKRKSQFAVAVSESKPVFDPSDKSYQEYLDDYYKLDCEDIVGGVPCRFKYREVIPNSFGLSIEEILSAKDRELNRWCSLKKAVQYRSDNVEKYDVIAFDKKGKNEVLKRKIFPSVYAEDADDKIKESKTDEIKENNLLSDNKAKSKKKNGVQNGYETKIFENNSSVEIRDELNTKSKKKKNTDKSATVGVMPKFSKKNNKNWGKINTTSDPDVNDAHKTIVTKQNVKNNYRNSEMMKNENKRSNVKAIKRKLSSTTMHDELPKKKKSKQGEKKIKKSNGNEPVKISDARLTAYGLKPKQFKNKLKYGKNSFMDK